jgi:hypothetical protein
MDHIIAKGNRIWASTERNNTWMIYHDHLKIWWEKDSQDLLRTLPCPIEGNPDHTWYDRQIKICGENNVKVATRYKGKLPGDSPELMPLDCHLFLDMQEGAAKNVALTYRINDGHEDPPRKYLFATPAKVFDALQCTIAAGCPSAHRIEQDVKCIFEETLGRIVEAQGCYIEDSLKKIVQSGVRTEAAADHKHETIPVNAAVLTRFRKMVEDMKSGGGVGFMFDPANVAEVCNDILTTRLVSDDNFDGNDNNREEEE